MRSLQTCEFVIILVNVLVHKPMQQLVHEFYLMMENIAFVKMLKNEITKQMNC